MVFFIVLIPYARGTPIKQSNQLSECHAHHEDAVFSSGRNGASDLLCEPLSMRILAIGVLLACASGVSPINLLSQTVSSVPSTIPFELVEDAGIRPVISMQVNGKPLRAVIHANAGTYLQINHQQASNVALTGVKHEGTYGIVKPGVLSSQGRDSAVAEKLVVGDVEDSAVPVDVFEKYSPDGQDVPMLGLPWIRAHKIILNFVTKQASLNPSKAEAQRQGEDLLKHGYARVKIFVDPEDGRYLVPVSLGGVQTMLVVGTVARTILDQGFATRAAIKSDGSKSGFAGPSGATGEMSQTNLPVRLFFHGATALPQRFRFADTYAYMRSVRPTDPGFSRGGDLGTDFLVDNGAVIDFGSGVLYLRKTPH